MALGVYGFGCEDALTHLLNYVWPNIFETSPHMVQSFNDAVDGLRVALGPSRILQYTLQVTMSMWAVFKKACWSLHALFGVWYRDSSTQQGKLGKYIGKYITVCILDLR